MTKCKVQRDWETGKSGHFYFAGKRTFLFSVDSFLLEPTFHSSWTALEVMQQPVKRIVRRPTELMGGATSIFQLPSNHFIFHLLESLSRFILDEKLPYKSKNPETGNNICMIVDTCLIAL